MPTSVPPKVPMIPAVDMTTSAISITSRIGLYRPAYYMREGGALLSTLVRKSTHLVLSAPIILVTHPNPFSSPLIDLVDGNYDDGLISVARGDLFHLL